MKRKLLILGMAMLAVWSADAQNRGKGATPAPKISVSRPVHKGTADVSGILIPPSFSSTNGCQLYYPTPTDKGGYLTGNNGYLDKEKLMAYRLAEYSAALPAHVDTVFALFSLKYLMGNGSVTAKIYSSNASGAPDALLATSAPVTVGAIDTTGNVLTTFTFANTVALPTERFYVSIDFNALYATGDTLALLNVADDCTDVDTTTAWEKWDDNTFISMISSWQFVTEMAIFPSITGAPLGVKGFVKNDFGAACYPVPATDQLVVSFTGQDNGSTAIRMKDITGKIVSTMQLNTSKGNTYKVPFDVSNLSRGLYFVELSSGSNKGMMKVSVQ